MDDARLTSQILERLCKELFDQPVMSNIARPHFVERLVASALEPEWRLVSADWAGWDLQRGAHKIEVKQSAALQSWAVDTSPGAETLGRFDVRTRAGYWLDGATWKAQAGRHADIYVFAWHGETDKARADHRRPSQWEFYVVAEPDLPAQKTIGLARVRRLATSVPLAELRQAVERLVSQLELSASTSAFKPS